MANHPSSRAKLGTRILCIVLSVLMVGGLATTLFSWLASLL
jgi:hypothetical protein